MKKGDICRGKIGEVRFPGKGIVYTEDETCVLRGGIPGQTVEYRVLKKRKGSFEGIILDVLAPGDPETEKAVCGIFPGCGGCMYQTMSYESQLEMKYSQVKNLLTPVLGPGTENVFTGIHGSPERFRYRNKMEYTFGDDRKDGPLTLGLHRKYSNYDVLTAGDCAIVHGDFNLILNCVLQYFTDHPMPYYHRMSHEGYLRHLLLRRSHTTGEILAALVTTSQAAPDLHPLAGALLALKTEGHIAGILHMINDSPADTVRSDCTEILFGKEDFYESVLGLRFRITPFSFFQTNTAGAETLYSIAREMIGSVENAVVFDLYSGTGTIGQMLAPSASRVIGVEIVEEAVRSAVENAALNGLDNCTFLCGDVLIVLDDIPDRPDFIVLDPPREGINPKALRKIIDYGVPRLVYISCKPTSLARDLQAFIAAGYRAERIECVDMFPMTVHVETVCCLYHQKKDFISVPYEPKAAEYLK